MGAPATEPAEGNSSLSREPQVARSAAAQRPEGAASARGTQRAVHGESVERRQIAAAPPRVELFTARAEPPLRFDECDGLHGPGRAGLWIQRAIGKKRGCDR